MTFGLVIEMLRKQNRNDHVEKKIDFDWLSAVHYYYFFTLKCNAIAWSTQNYTALYAPPL
jgi:hypothetical protein